MSKRIFDIAKRRAIEKETSKFLVSAQPFLIMILVLLLAILFNKIWGDDKYLNLVVLFISVSTVALSMLTWDTSRSRKGSIGRIQAVVNMVCVGFWIAAATAVGPFTRPVIDIWVLGGIVLCFAWVIRNAIKNDTSRQSSDIHNFFEEEGIPGAKLKVLSSSVNKMKALITLSPGKNSVEDIKRMKSKFASFFKAPLTGIRIDPDPENASQGFLTVVRKDMLKQVTPYPDFENIKVNVEDPIRIGLYEDAELAKFVLHTQQLGANHMLIQGMNGSGKSAAALVIFAELFQRENVISWVIDTVKGSQTLHSVNKGIDWIINDESTANALFKRFKNIIKARADHLGSLRLDKWNEDCGLSFLHIHIEEASGLIASNPAFIKMMETARSVGVQITASLQRASHVAIDTAARAQFSSVLCFGVADDADANFALPDDVLDAGANPAIWRNSKPGYAYLIGPEIDQMRWTTPLRTYYIDSKNLSEIDLTINKRPLDNITKNALGDLYKAQIEQSEESEEWEEGFEEEDMSIDDEIQSDDTLLIFPKYEKNVTPEQARRILLDKILEFKGAGRRRFSAPDLKDVIEQVGKSRAWIHKELQKLVDDDILQREDYDYIIM
jgi:hypothetical protein